MSARTSTVIFAIILCAYLAALQVTGSKAWFGYSHDDSLYFASARALAAGQGYVNPSLPGAPAQTKYPIGYPWLLSWVWRFEAQFPENLPLAFWLNALMGCAFLAGCWALLRQLQAGRPLALALTAVCAFHPVTLRLSGMLLSDVPFAALAIWTTVAAAAAISRPAGPKPAHWKLWPAAIVLGAVAVLVRSMGVALIGALTLAALRSRSYRAAAGSLLAGGAAFLASRAGGAALAAPSADAVSDGYAQTLLFYTSYLGFWRFSVPDWATLGDQLIFNLLEFLKAPTALCLLLPVAGFAPGIWQATGVALSAGIAKGVIRRGAHIGWRHPIHWAFLFHVPVLLAWNYTLMDRFLLPFLPLLLLGALEEGQRIVQSSREVFRKPGPLADRIITGVLLAVVGSLLAYGAYRYAWEVPAALARATARRERLNQEKREAYRWMRARTSSGDRFVAYEDVTLYLHTGRESMRPIAPSTAAFYRQEESLLERDLERLSDTAQAIEARFWLVASDDYHLESADTYLRDATAHLVRPYPVVFRSSQGGVRVHDVSRLR